LSIFPCCCCYWYLFLL